MNGFLRVMWAWGAVAGGWLVVAATPVAPFEQARFAGPANAVDERVFGRLRELGITPALPCSDAVFLRRAYLDVIGTLPTLEESRAFLLDRRSDKRRRLIEQLLARDEFADYWAMKWCDLLRVKSEFPINLWPNAVQAYHRWIHTALRDNWSYDRFARALLTASGSNFRVPPVNFWRAVQGHEPATLARAVALNFMGVRADRWPPERLEGMASFFANVAFKSTGEWKEEIVFFDPAATNADLTAGPRRATFPDGKQVWLFDDRDPREVFADWLIQPDNPWFARNLANRVWSWLLGRGIVHEPDDFRPDNPPSNPELLDLLARELVRAQYDVKALFRLILNSRTYQLSSIPRSKDPRAAAQFACYPVRRLEAEVLIDALCQISGTTEKYQSPIPEPFTFIPEGQRSIALADGSITSSFLELFGRPPRDTGLESERNNQPTADQRLHLLNSTHIQRKIERSPKLRALTRAKGTPRQKANRIYLTLLSRLPTPAEVELIQRYARSGPRPNEVAVDMVWALINSPEFLYRH
jgi:hypothetical protein